MNQESGYGRDHLHSNCYALLFPRWLEELSSIMFSVNPIKATKSRSCSMIMSSTLQIPTTNISTPHLGSSRMSLTPFQATFLSLLPFVNIIRWIPRYRQTDYFPSLHCFPNVIDERWTSCRSSPSGPRHAGSSAMALPLIGFLAGGWGSLRRGGLRCVDAFSVSCCIGLWLEDL